MQLHQARRADLSNKKKVRVGRGPGSGLGKTAGRGIKGATSRSGYAMKVTYEGGQMPLFRRLPKRGFTNGKFRVTFSVVNLCDLLEFKAGETVGPDQLRDAGLLQGKATNPIKILGDGEFNLALTIRADAFSKSALEKILKAGGKAEWIGGVPAKKAPNFKQIAEDKRREALKTKGDAKAEAPKAEAGDKPAASAAPKVKAEAKPKGEPKAEKKSDEKKPDDKKPEA